jgi:hypothetical protein
MPLNGVLLQSQPRARLKAADIAVQLWEVTDAKK